MAGYVQLNSPYIRESSKLLRSNCDNANDCEKLSLKLQKMQHICDDIMGIKKGTKRDKDTLCGQLEKRKKYISGKYGLYSDIEREKLENRRQTTMRSRSRSHKRSSSSRSRGGKRRNRTSKTRTIIRK